MTKSQLHFEMLNSKMQEINNGLKKEQGFMNHLKNLARINEIEHNETLRESGRNSLPPERKLSPENVSIRSALHERDAQQNMNPRYSRYDSSQGHNINLQNIEESSEDQQELIA